MIKLGFQIKKPQAKNMMLHCCVRVDQLEYITKRSAQMNKFKSELLRSILDEWIRRDTARIKTLQLKK